MSAGKLDRRVQFRRASVGGDGFTSAPVWDDVSPEINNLGAVQWAAKQDVSDSERWRAGEVAANVTARFTLRWSEFTRGITPADRLACEGRVYEITGIKESDGRHRWLEFTCAARND